MLASGNQQIEGNPTFIVGRRLLLLPTTTLAGTMSGNFQPLRDVQ